MGMQIAVREARTDDFEFCADLYLRGMERAIRNSKLDI